LLIVWAEEFVAQIDFSVGGSAMRAIALCLIVSAAMGAALCHAQITL
jgi:hypothetical protein